MEFGELLTKVSSLPWFSTGLLAAGRRDLASLRVQISRWVKDGKVVKLRKGIYTLAEPYAKIRPHPFAIANGLKAASYVSLQSALSWYGLIPEFVPATTSVTTGRPQTLRTPLGRFEFRHVKKTLFRDFEKIELPDRQEAFVARPEKALVDLIYLTPGADDEGYLRELRLQNFDAIDKDKLESFIRATKSAKLRRAFKYLGEIINKSEGVRL